MDLSLISLHRKYSIEDFFNLEVFNYANELFIPVNSLVNFKAAFMKMGESLLQELDG